MNEIKCPKCGGVFQVSEADYASIVNQVKDQAFQRELEQRIQQVREQARLEQEYQRVRQEQAQANALQAKAQEIEQLKARLQGFDKNKQLELANELLKKDQEILSLKSYLSQQQQATQIQWQEQRAKDVECIRHKEQEIATLTQQLTQAGREAEQQAQTLKERYELEISSLKEENARIKDYKLKLSTKMIGESLEQHCSTEFNKQRTIMYPRAYFEKDNDASGGSKGDFIFRDYVEEQEYVSIMFEMKNEAEGTVVKHKNEEFFAKLDKDRNEKKCEYAVLVSMLEPENELYNTGIVDVSYRYPKMFVIRPQFFMPLIALLAQASRKSVDYIKELALARSQHIDVTNFEDKLGKFRDAFGNNVRLAVKNHEDAIAKIESTIKTLQGIKEMFEKSNKYLELADRRLEEDFTVRKLTYNNPTMKAKFEEVRQQKPGYGEAVKPMD